MSIPDIAGVVTMAASAVLLFFGKKYIDKVDFLIERVAVLIEKMNAHEKVTQEVKDTLTKHNEDDTRRFDKIFERLNELQEK